MRVLLLIVVVAGLAGCSAWPGSGVSTSLHPVAPCTWQRVAVPGPGGGESRFDAVTAPSPESAWAVGSYFSGHEAGPFGPVIERWDGARWRVVTGVVKARSELSAAASTAPGDVWIGGSRGHHALISHWDGHAWRAAALPPVGGSSMVSDIAALGRDDVWAVGSSERDLRARPLAMHYDGHRWSLVPSPSPPPAGGHGRVFAGFEAISALGPDDVWAVGFTQMLELDGPADPLIEHWDGTRWAVSRTPRPAGFSMLMAVAAVSADNVWAYGDRNSLGAGYGGGGDHPLVLHWDGRRWSVMSHPTAVKRGMFFGAAVVGGRAVAVGDQAGEPWLTLMGSYVAGHWVMAPRQSGALDDVAQSGGTAWAVGQARSRPLALRC